MQRIELPEPAWHPAPFSRPMVRALLAGVKTQTRRLIRVGAETQGIELRDGAWYAFGDRPTNYDGEVQMNDWRRRVRCPYGQVGDRLWVRESYSGPRRLAGVPPGEWPRGTPVWYWADGDPPHGDWTRPKPPMHMPRWACRLQLTVKELAADRLQGISALDAREEGAMAWLDEQDPRVRDLVKGDARIAYEALWESLHGVGSWARDPWVWVVKLQRFEPSKEGDRGR